MTGLFPARRPAAITAFMWCFLAGIVGGVVATLLRWSVVARDLAGNEQTAGFGWMLPTITIVGVLAQLAILYLIVVRRIGALRWLVAVIAAFDVARVIRLKAWAGLEPSPLMIVFVATAAVMIAAAVLPFTRGGDAWFQRPVEGGSDE